MTLSASPTADVVIVGGAVMGSSTAYHLLADPGFKGRVIVIEKDPTYQLSASALSMTRMALDLGTRQSFESALTNVENLYLHELMKTEDAEEGVRAFIEKRKPEWKNK